MTRVLVTGVRGVIGRKLQQALIGEGHTVTGLDLASEEPAEQADLQNWDEVWVDRFEGQDLVVHLAAQAGPNADWGAVQGPNIGATLNVLEAAARHGVRRVVFASSNWVLAGYRGSGVSLCSSTPPWPVNAYGASKLACESIGRFYSQVRGISVICLRIGYSQHTEGNQPGAQMAGGLWGQRMWLSDTDLTAGFRAAMDAGSSVRFATVNLVSDNAGMTWDLCEAFEQIAYRPQSHSRPLETPELVAREALVQQLNHRTRDIDRLFSTERL